MYPAVKFLGAIGGIAAVVEIINHFTETDHDDVVEDAYEAVEKAVSGDASVYVAHVREDEPSPKGVLDHTNKVPDILVHGGPGPNRIIEVETGDSLENRAVDAIAQLEAFQSPGYQRILVVPSGATEAGEELVADLDGTIRVATPSELGNLF